MGAHYDYLVRGRIREFGRSNAKLRIGGVEDGVEPLEERIPVDEVKASARDGANLRDYK
jgi:hypothetical protein